MTGLLIVYAYIAVNVTLCWVFRRKDNEGEEN